MSFCATYDAVNNLTRQEFAQTGYPTLRADFAYNENNLLENETRYSDLAGSTKVAYSTFCLFRLTTFPSLILEPEGVMATPSQIGFSEISVPSPSAP